MGESTNGQLRSNDVYAELTSRVHEIRGTIGFVYQTSEGWWAEPKSNRHDRRVFPGYRNAVAYVRNCART